MPKITYAIGDIHGCHNAMMNLLQQIFAHADGFPDDYTFKIVFCGDYVDRGPDSKKVIDTLISLQEVPPERFEIIALKGNHEDMLIEAHGQRLLTGLDLAAMDFPTQMYSNGENATLQSFGVRSFGEIHIKYIYYIDQLPLYHEDALRVFVHAGLDPDQPDMSKQNPWNLIWLRQPFVDSHFKMFKYVVHGHTPYDPQYGVREWGNKVNLDTAAVFGGDLTCAVFNDIQERPIGYLSVKKVQPV